MLAAFASILIGIVCIAVGCRYADRFGLIDRPGGRKTHTGNVPLIGGPLTYLMVLSGCLISDTLDYVSVQTLVFSSLIFAIGLVDDIRSVSWRIRLLFQVIASSGMIYFSGLIITNLGSFIWIVDIELGLLAIPATILAVVGLTNALNMIDGHDGFAGISILVAMLGMILFDASLLQRNGVALYLTLALTMYLFCNLGPIRKVKVFLGDSGSTLLGFMLAWLLIREAQFPNSEIPVEAVPWFICIPVFDFARVISMRLIKGKKLVGADQTHLHHVLLFNTRLRRGPITAFLILSLSAITIGHFIVIYAPSFSILTFVFLAIIYSVLIEKWLVSTAKFNPR